MAKMGRALALLLAVATTVSAQTTQPCPSGWRAFNGNCYYFGDRKYWTEARDDCLQRGAVLAVITDSATNDYIANMGKLEFHTGTYDTKFWLGLNDRATEGDFRWTDGSKPTYENWAPGEPNNMGGEDCAQIYVNSKEWNDVECPSDKWHYVCQLKYNDVDECADGLDNCDPNASCTNTPDGFTCACNTGYTGDGTTCTAVSSRTCPSGWREFNDNCYFFGPKDTWFNALSYCQNIGAGMAVITDSATNDFIGDLAAPEVNSVIWIGLNDLVIEGEHRWTDGSKPSYTNWNPNQPSNGGAYGDEDCTQMILSSKKWNDVYCHNTLGILHFVCQLEYAVDECADGTDNCDPNASCTDTASSFTCTCNYGFIGDGTSCTDVDECADGLDNCDPNASCTNTPGGFTCACNAGYTGDSKMCTDVDECADGSNNCDPNASCTNTPGGFTCACNAGYTGDGIICTADTFSCSDGQTIPSQWTCDRIVDCSRAEDELICGL